MKAVKKMFCYYSKLLDIILYKTSAEGVIVRNLLQKRNIV